MAEKTSERNEGSSSATDTSLDTKSQDLTPIDLESTASCPAFYLPAPNSTKEPFRDISCLGPITLHRLFLVIYLVGFGAAIYIAQLYIWPLKENPDVWYAHPLLGLIWLPHLPSSILFLIGAIMYRVNTKLDQVKPIKHNVVFRIVSRGINAECLMDTIRSCQEEMARNPMFPYLIEVVTDADVFEAPDAPDVIQLRVPPSYQTPNNTMYKARALNYASERSVVPPNTWVVHLDEETHPTSSGVKGIAQFVGECEEKQDLKRVGQGCLLYHRAFEKHPFLTIADMRRTGDDFGHFYLQHRIGFTLFGLHGSYIVCRHDMEAALGFDIGPRGSITEDSWWILLAMERGYRTKWVDGYLEEQSTQRIMDFLKQRRRWYFGLVKVAAYCPVPLKYRLYFGFHIVMCTLTPIIFPTQLAYTILLFVKQISVHAVFRVLSVFSFEIFILIYFAGLVINMHEHKTKWWKQILYIISLVITIPACTIMEIVAIIMAFFAPFSKNGRGFHVVQKSGKTHEKTHEVVDSTDTEEETIEPKALAVVAQGGSNV